ncbi:hypothetical protein V8F33_006028 [Rhypophila sp. PSN 637]
MDNGSGYDVYLGHWINWSRGPILGSTLTMTRTNGNLLIAFLAFFVAIVAARFWRIVCLLVHFRLSSDQPCDALYHQRQAVLRNASNPEEGFWTFLDLILAWRKSSRRPFLRLVPPLLLAATCMVIFTVAGGFSSMVQLSADDVGSEVLLTGKACIPHNIILPKNMTSYDYEAIWYPYLAREHGDYSDYAQQCSNSKQGGAGILKCGTFVQQKIDFQTNYSAGCPFGGKLCKSNDSNIFIDTGYLDSHEHFGLNAPPDQRVLVRKTLHCAPLVTEGYKDTFNTTPSRSYTRYYYGQSRDFNFTTRELYLQNFTYKYSNDYRDRNQNLMASYSVGWHGSFKTKGNEILGSSFKPIPELDVPNANVYLIFLSANQVRFAQETHDPWYTATTLAGPRVNLNTDKSDLQVYWMDEPASPLGCTEMMQFCNPSLPAGSPNRCTPLAGSFDPDDITPLFTSPGSSPSAAELELNADRIKWVADAVDGPSVSSLMMNLGAQSLTSRYSVRQGLQGPLPTNQWQRDVEHWMNSILAGNQAMFVRTAAGPTESSVKPFYAPTDTLTPTERNLCASQKILSTEYASFSVLGVVLTLVLGAVIIMLSMSLEGLLGCLSRRLYGELTYAQLEWCTNETLQLQRQVQEGLFGLGSWVGATNNVPRTKMSTQRLGVLDLADRGHPRWGRPESLEDQNWDALDHDMKKEKTELTRHNTDEITMVGKLDSGLDLRSSFSRGSTMDSNMSKSWKV